jgi:hypothetical protein
MEAVEFELVEPIKDRSRGVCVHESSQLTAWGASHVARISFGGLMTKIRNACTKGSQLSKKALFGLKGGLFFWE